MEKISSIHLSFSLSLSVSFLKVEWRIHSGRIISSRMYSPFYFEKWLAGYLPVNKWYLFSNNWFYKLYPTITIVWRNVQKLINQLLSYDCFLTSYVMFLLNVRSIKRYVGYYSHKRKESIYSSRKIIISKHLGSCQNFYLFLRLVLLRYLFPFSVKLNLL